MQELKLNDVLVESVLDRFANLPFSIQKKDTFIYMDTLLKKILNQKNFKHLHSPKCKLDSHLSSGN